MAYAHVAHDCIIGDNCILANSATLAGHVTIGDYVILGGKTAILQFVKIGDHVITAGGSLVDKDVPPYIRAARYPIAYAGINSVGLNRRGFSRESISIIQDIYRYLFQKGYTVSHAVELAKEQYANTDEGKLIFDFIAEANVGLLKGYTSGK
jgi:UDP-N-acetylglucosamine acyltransferase